MRMCCLGRLLSSGWCRDKEKVVNERRARVGTAHQRLWKGAGDGRGKRKDGSDNRSSPTHLQ